VHADEPGRTGDEQGLASFILSSGGRDVQPLFALGSRRYVQYKTKNAKSPPAGHDLLARCRQYGPSPVHRSWDGRMNDMATEAAALRRWLFQEALPLWWAVGADRDHGGFHEAINLDGSPAARPHRARSITRVAFSYCEAGRLGWDGPWREAAQHALDYFRKHFVTADATVASIVDLDGRVRDAPFDLYEQAFALLAYASGHRAFGEAAGWRAQAVALRTALEQHYANPLGGLEDRAGGCRGREPAPISSRRHWPDRC
jgi:hypothetical protein